MSKKICISLDAMGGDYGVDVVLPAADMVLQRCPSIELLLFGDLKVIEPMLEEYPRLKQAALLRHCDVSIGMDEKPSQALRKGRGKSSMWQSIAAVKNGEADVAVSAGNTGALMAMAKFCLRTMSGIERPALAAIWPTMRGESIVLDVGATIGADAQQLIDFAILGCAMSRSIHGINQPTVGLLNVGVEEVKGVEEVRTAGKMLRSLSPPNLVYSGFVEGDDIGKGAVDVVVTEGFAGNIALKTAEGTVKQFTGYLRAAMNRTLMSKIGYLFARGAFARLRAKLDPRKVNGGVFLGLNGIVIKSHGGSDAEGFAAAVELAYDMARNELIKKISDDLANYHRGRFSEAEDN
ncbi:Phosphate acyltransferase [Pseudovibrio axinellae]|uniref:Phosphate acyltransferase n=1 Tax=Pseudovibrio axinellae TaxID=989403 RepID=A0A165WNM5_9HYPH|nr:phosphate acyltransferase PlsX [Pseudovibrio axinellae]KZL16736.1 Phosphate acyltransferase [Pseudovibrio axinellae]SEQ76726.1 phosphate:acyl-[acyl carrier protein] acyltransferase [Pseudovibrio axinellae]